jgi:amidase
VPHYPSLAKTGVKGLRICRLSEGLDRPLADKRVSDLVVKAAKALAELGAVVDELSVPFHKEASDVWAVSQFALLILVWMRLG